jgi:hypothetical protein
MPHHMGSPYNNQQRGGFDWSQFMPKQSFWSSPGFGMAAQGVGGLLQALFSGGEQRRHEKWQHGQQRRLMDMFGGQLGSGPVINPDQMNRLQSYFTQGMQPQMDKIGYGASRHAGLASPESHRLTANAQMPLMAQFLGNLSQQNISMTQNRDMMLRQLMAALTRG